MSLVADPVGIPAGPTHFSVEPLDSAHEPFTDHDTSKATLTSFLCWGRRGEVFD